MKIYLAPLEGITGYVYRNAYHALFCDADKYFTPFLTPHTKRSFNAREKKDLLPENNKDMYVVPQILTKSAEDFLMITEELREFGYEECNLNAGCPSGTVVSKGRGAGLLDDVRALDKLLDGIFAKTKVDVSVKTRIGMEFESEFEDILKVYNSYPLKELVIHPRLRKDFYSGEPNWDMFAYALEHSTNPVVYNGDIFDRKKYEHFGERFPKADTVMVGRGVIANPGLIGELKGEAPVTKQQYQKLHDCLVEGYREEMAGDKNVLFKMKEFWFYMGQSFEDAAKHLKKIKKASRLEEYLRIVEELFEVCTLIPRDE